MAGFFHILSLEVVGTSNNKPNLQIDCFHFKYVVVVILSRPKVDWTFPADLKLQPWEVELAIFALKSKTLFSFNFGTSCFENNSESLLELFSFYHK